MLGLLSSLMVPVQVTIIPLFLLMRTFGLLDNPLSLILPGITGALGVFLMRQFFLRPAAGDPRRRPDRRCRPPGRRTG